VPQSDQIAATSVPASVSLRTVGQRRFDSGEGRRRKRQENSLESAVYQHICAWM
jgi:hypothetical protein